MATGFAVLDCPANCKRAAVLDCGTWVLDAPTFPLRARQLAGRLAVLLCAFKPSIVAVELPAVFKSAAAARSGYGLLAVAEVVAAEHGHPSLVEVNIAHVKQRATGRGNATKPDMVAAAGPLLGWVPDHNAADALFVALLAADRRAP